ncbi:sugar ABC transporter permease [Paenibacillus sp. alder61]|uniref:Sugar ABC transporter permease n=1 Tax=Paenibacillus faecis TaxID=862114 RepID=A0A5D0CQI8_9BACL|nr:MULTISPECIES: sugar ABC transporter permease [Paenibacillus]MCA1293473.1 sugar ABC transporter permease [Paenibacillus sp. alder61]TYA12123.1 sugar ABC transporter permease [Paenibacillus faecis]
MSHKSGANGSYALSRRAKWFSSWNNYLFVLPALVFMVIFIGFPLIYNLLLSFQNVNVYNLSGEHDFVGFSNYIKSLKDPVFYTALQNSAVFTVVSIFFQFTIGFALALFFNLKFPGRNLFRSLMLLAWMMPVVISGTVFQWMMSGDFGVINYFLQTLGIIDRPINWLSEGSTALLGTVVANIWIGIPFNMIILLSGLQGLPDHLYEAAKLDGANRLVQFRHITLPLMRPTILVLLILGIINTFKVFDLIFIMTQGGPVTSSTVLPIYAYQLSFTTLEFSQGASVSMIMFLILVVISIVYLRMSSKEEVH